jgi:hypothetical protein
MSVGVMKDENLKLRDLYMSVGVMKDEKLKLRDLHASHTLCCVGDWNTQKAGFVYYETIMRELKR